MSLHQLRVAWGVSVLLACGSGPPPREPAVRPAPRRDPIPRTRGPSCRALADRMAVVIGEHAPIQPEGNVHAHGLYELRCDTGGWSDDARSCLATISSDEEADGCLRLLDRDQRRRLAAERARLAADRDDAHEEVVAHAPTGSGVTPALVAAAVMRYGHRVGILKWLRRDGGEPRVKGWFRGARRVRVREVFGESEMVEPKVLYETTDPEEIARLAETLQTGPGSGAHCMCVGTLIYEIEFRAGIRRISLHHGESVRVDNEFENLPLLSPDACIDWLSAHGVTFVREQYEEDRRQRAKSASQAERWRTLLPSSLVPFFDGRGFEGKPPSEWTAALAVEYPDLQQRAIVLLRLFGSGAGPWSGYPSYEGMPETLLLEMPLEVLLAAAAEASDDRGTEGAARLFAGWYFGRQRPGDRAALPAELKRRLLTHAERSADEDKRARARAAFGG